VVALDLCDGVVVEVVVQYDDVEVLVHNEEVVEVVVQYDDVEVLVHNEEVVEVAVNDHSKDKEQKSHCGYMCKVHYVLLIPQRH
jgi:hypothetical protein